MTGGKNNFFNSLFKSYFHTVTYIAIKIIKNTAILKNIHNVISNWSYI